MVGTAHMRTERRWVRLSRMNETEFPLPEAEANKLNRIETTLAAQPRSQKLSDAVRADPWRYAALAMALGVCCGVAIARR